MNRPNSKLKFIKQNGCLWVYKALKEIPSSYIFNCFYILLYIPKYGKHTPLSFCYFSLTNSTEV